MAGVVSVTNATLVVDWHTLAIEVRDTVAANAFVSTTANAAHIKLLAVHATVATNAIVLTATNTTSILHSKRVWLDCKKKKRFKK